MLSFAASLAAPAGRAKIHKMKWFQRYPTPAEAMGVLFAAALMCLVAFVAIWGPGQQANAGFGPDWDCKIVPQSTPICIKKPGR
jgi:hypothetical protein